MSYTIPVENLINCFQADLKAIIHYAHNAYDISDKRVTSDHAAFTHENQSVTFSIHYCLWTIRQLGGVSSS